MFRKKKIKMRWTYIVNNIQFHLQTFLVPDCILTLFSLDFLMACNTATVSSSFWDGFRSSRLTYISTESKSNTLGSHIKMYYHSHVEKLLLSSGFKNHFKSKALSHIRVLIQTIDTDILI